MTIFQQPSSKVLNNGDLTEKEFKMVAVSKLNELPKNSERQFNEIRNKIYEQNEFF